MNLEARVAQLREREEAEARRQELAKQAVMRTEPQLLSRKAILEDFRRGDGEC